MIPILLRGLSYRYEFTRTSNILYSGKFCEAEIFTIEHQVMQIPSHENFFLQPFFFTNSACI